MRVLALDRAQKTIVCYADLVQVEDEEDVIIDMLADVIQWCAYRNVDFDEALRIASTHAEIEMREDEQ